MSGGTRSTGDSESASQSAQFLRQELAKRAGNDWELYRKAGQSRELVSTVTGKSELWRREEGWAARWWQDGAPHFAFGSGPEALAGVLEPAGGVRVTAAPPLEWPRAKAAQEPAPAASGTPPDLFEQLTRELSAESRGEALLKQLTLRQGGTSERIENGAGLDVAQASDWLDGHALAVGRRGTRACEARLVFRSNGPPDVAAMARRLADRSILPLSDRSSPIERGEWLLDPSVAAVLLAGISPLFSAARPPRWLTRSRFAAPGVTIVDDATADASFDGEGTATRRVLLVDAGELVGRLHDLRSAAQAGAKSTGHGVRPSYRVAPSAGPRRVFYETAGGSPPLDLLSSVRRGLFASALTAPARLDLEEDRFEIEFTGIAIMAGRAQTPVAGARARGRISQLLRRIRALATDRQFFPMPFLAGAPTILIERADFD